MPQLDRSVQLDACVVDCHGPIRDETGQVADWTRKLKTTVSRGKLVRECLHQVAVTDGRADMELILQLLDKMFSVTRQTSVQADNFDEKLASQGRPQIAHFPQSGSIHGSLIPPKSISQMASQSVVFTARCYASAVLAMALCLSVRPSVCLSVRHKPVFY